MSILDNVTTGSAYPPRITIYGKPGVGKSTLASQFPNPLFLLTEENGLHDVKHLPLLTNFKDVWNAVQNLLKEPKLPFDTIVLDSISKLDSLVIKHILENEPPNKNGQKPSSLNSACGGYGAGFSKAQMMHWSLKGLFDKFRERGIGVVFISHLDVKKHKSPDNEDYDIYTVVMNHDKSREVYINDVDLVAFCRLKSFTTETESGRVLVKSTQDRVMQVGLNESHVSKNRFDMPDELPMDFGSIVKYVPFYQKKQKG